MKLEDLLKKSKFKAGKGEYTLKPVSIATDDRPYIDKPRPNLGQPDSNEIATRYQPDSNQTANQKQDNGKRDSNKVAIRQQPDSEPDSNPSALVGIQKRLFEYIFELCLIRDENSTGHISTMEIAKKLDYSYGNIKCALVRLVSKRLIKRLKGKGCKGGFISLEIPKEIKIIAIKTKRFKPDSNEIATRHQPDSNQIANEIATPPSSSSINIKTTTKLLAGWEAVSMDRLSGYDFLSTTVRQLSEFKLVESPDSAQRSINNFAEFLRTSRKEVKSPASYFMRIMRDTGKFEYTAPSRPIEVPKRVETEAEKWAALNRYKPKT